MRKYLIAGLAGLLLMAGQAAASDSAALNVGDRVGSPEGVSNNWSGTDTFALVVGGGAFIGLMAWALSHHDHGGVSSSP